MMMIIPEFTVSEKVKLENHLDDHEQESKGCLTSSSGGQRWNLNCEPPRPLSPEDEPFMMNVSSSPPKKKTQVLDRTEEVDESDDEQRSVSSSRHEQRQFYYWDAIRWVKFPTKTNSLLCAAQKRTSETIILPVADNRLYKIDFKNKLRMNLKTGYVRSIAWEGSSTGSREFAGFDKPFERQELLPSDDRLVMMSRSQQEHDIESTTSPSLPPCNVIANERVDTGAAVAVGSCQFQSKAVETFAKLGDMVAVLEPGNIEFNAVNDVFNKGFSRPPPNGKRPRLTAVHKVNNNEAKLRYFSEQLRSMERLRANANLKHAWHGSSSDAIVSIVMYGFGQRPMSLNGNNFGCGTYLAPCLKLDVSVQYAEVDTNMEQHVLLCEVVLGESEVIPPGSCHRFLPSSTSYDSGVDDLDNPSLYIIWTPFINSHIIPWYIVSFVTEDATRKFSGPMRRYPEINRPSPYFSSPRQQPIQHVNNVFYPSASRTFSESSQQELLARASAVLPATGFPHRENNHNDAVYEHSDTCSVKALNVSKERLQEAATRSIQAAKTTYHHNNDNINLDGLTPKDNKLKSSISGTINLNLGLNIDGFSHQTRHPKRLTRSLRHQ